MKNPYKEGSRKAEIYDVFMKAGGGEKGLAAAHKHAVKKTVGIQPSSIKSWGSMWLKGETKPAKKELPAPKPKAETTEPHFDGLSPEFKYPSRAAADKAHEALCTRAGLRAHAFHVIEQGGKFAVVPASKHVKGAPPQFEKGDFVYDSYVINSKAKVMQPGPEQSVIRYETEAPKGLSRPREVVVPNYYLIKLADKPKAKRERL